MDDVTSLPNFRALFEAAPDIYLVLSPDLTIVAASNACCIGSSQCARDKMVGRNLFDVFPTNPDDPDQTAARDTRASLARVLQFRRPDRMAVHKYDVCRPDPEGYPERYWSVLHAPVLNESGEVSWIIHRAEDVTEIVRLQREAEASVVHTRHHQQIIERLQKTSSFLDAVIDNVPGMLFVKSYPDRRYVLLNREAQELVGYQGKDYLGKTDYDLFTQEQAEYFAAQDRAVFESGEPLLSPEEPTTTREKGMRVLRTTKIPVKDKDGRTEYLLGFSEDITERKEIEQQLRQALKMDAVGQLTGGIAHDFNNVLGIIIGNLDVAAELAASNPDLLRVIHDALAGALRGAELTRRLLAFSRKRPLQPAIIDLNQILPDTAGMLRRTLGEQVVVELHLGTDLWPARVDPGQLDEAILNLAINARDAMPQGGVLSIETRNVHLDRDYALHHADVIAGPYVRLSVGDTGSGMPPDVLEHCFEPFYTTKSAEKGTGLGLSMVYAFVKRSDGHIKVYSEVGHGTTVHIYLPRAEEAPAGRPRAEEDDGPLPTGSELVLIVEDDEGLRAVTVKQLRNLGYRTLEARNAKQALEVLAAHPDIDLLFTDIVMPGGMTGADLARKARQLYPKLKILLTSGYTARAMTQGFGDIEGLELLDKPYRRRDLAMRLRAELDRA
jgi:PAS domain S-box-containing protein